MPEENWLQNSDVLTLFPTLVWKIQFLPEFAETQNLKVIDVLKKINPDITDFKETASWQSQQSLHQETELDQLMLCINNTAQKVLRFLNIGATDIEVTGCWANVYGVGAFHRMHNHPNNYLSGVYYVRVPTGANTINFHDPRSQASVIRPPVTQLTGQNTDQVVVEVSEGTLLLFPSYLMHSVDANDSSEPRISISFNFMFSEFAGTMSKPLWESPPSGE